MARRIAPYKNVDPHDEISYFALGDAYINDNVTGTGFGDAGVFVTVQSGNANNGPVSFTDNGYLGYTSFPNVGYNKYPEIALKVKPAYSGDYAPLGITLNETARYDENGQKLLYYQEKADAMQISLPGQSVRIATRGEFTVYQGAVDGTLTPGQSFKLSANSGKITGATLGDSAALGFVLATGTRGANGAQIADVYSGNYYMIKLGK